jgi:hypothetical protein
MPKPVIRAEDWLQTYEKDLIPIGVLQDLRKGDLFALAEHFGLECKKSHLKAAILSAVCVHLQEEQWLGGELPPQPEVKPKGLDPKLEEYQLELHQVKQDLIRLETERAHQQEVAALRHKNILAKQEADALLAQTRQEAEVRLLKADVAHFQSEADANARRADRFTLSTLSSSYLVLMRMTWMRISAILSARRPSATGPRLKG